MDIVSLVIAMGIPSAITGFCFWLLKRHIDKNERRREEQEKLREKSQINAIKGISASIALGEACAIAIQRGKPNGEIEKALEYARKIKHEQKDFYMEQGVKSLF